MNYLLLILIAFASCVTTKEPKYKVRSVEHISGNAYRVTTDSFTVIKCFRGMGKFPETIKK